MIRKNKTFKKIDKLLLVFLASLVFSVLGLVLSRIGFHDIKKDIIYQESKNIDYRVYLNPNEYFEEEYLQMNQSYITSLIDYIDVKFEYKLDFNEKLSGEYSYYIKAIVEANQENSDSNYFTKEYVLLPRKTKKYENLSSIILNEIVKVDYPLYNELLVNFKNDYGIDMDGNLKIVLVIDNNIVDPIYNEKINREGQIELDVPLTSQVVEVPISADDNVEDGILKEITISKDGLIYLILKILGITSYVFAFSFVLYLIYLSIISIRMESVYHKKLNKILRVYDGIIVNLKTMPKFVKEKLFIVNTFEELIDAHSEVRNPINYIDEKDGAIFLLMSNGYIYYYKLKRELFSENNYREEKNEKSFN